MGCLVLTRKIGEDIIIRNKDGDEIKIVFVRTWGAQLRVAITSDEAKFKIDRSDMKRTTKAMSEKEKA